MERISVQRFSFRRKRSHKRDREENSHNEEPQENDISKMKYIRYDKSCYAKYKYVTSLCKVRYHLYFKHVMILWLTALPFNLSILHINALLFCM